MRIQNPPGYILMVILLYREFMVLPMGSSGDVGRDMNVGRLRSENKAQRKLKEAVPHPLCLVGAR